MAYKSGIVAVKRSYTLQTLRYRVLAIRKTSNLVYCKFKENMKTRKYKEMFKKGE